eukprot:1160599-Pelagomonas_calceolata.AAC.13
MHSSTHRCSCRQLCGHASARRVVGVHVDHQVGEALAQRAHKHGGGLGLEQACGCVRVPMHAQGC